MKEKIEYYASAENILCMGPYPSSIKAWEALRGHDGLPVPSGRVWPQRVKNKIIK